MELGAKGNEVIQNDILKVLAKIKNKYWKLGRSVALTKIPDEIKAQFYSLGNDMDKFFSLAKTLEVKDVTSVK